MIIFFFFQAEDGIRDVAVTGVQTCALPIARTGRNSSRGGRSRPDEALSRASLHIDGPHVDRLVDHTVSLDVRLFRVRFPVFARWAIDDAVCLDVLVVGGCWLFALFHYSSFCPPDPDPAFRPLDSPDSPYLPSPLEKRQSLVRSPDAGDPSRAGSSSRCR